MNKIKAEPNEQVGANEKRRKPKQNEIKTIKEAKGKRTSETRPTLKKGEGTQGERIPINKDEEKGSETEKAGEATCAESRNESRREE